MKILVAEDEKKVQKFIRQALTQAGMVVDCVPDCPELLSLLQTTQYDVLVMDRLLHGYDALTLLPMLRRKNPKMRILVLSALDDLESRVKGLTEGADDYLGKPFHVAELTARVRSLGRRQDKLDTEKAGTNLIFEDLRVNLENQTVVRGPKKVDLTKKEFQILVLFMKSPGRVFSKTEILDRVWDMNRDPESNIVEVTIANLRGKLEKGPSPLIKSQRGIGYWIGER